MQVHDRLSPDEGITVEGCPTSADVWDELPDAPHPDDYVPPASGVYLVRKTVMSDGQSTLGPCGFVTVQIDAEGLRTHDCGASPSCPLEES